MSERTALIPPDEIAARDKIFEQLRVRFCLIARHHLGKELADDAAHTACLIVLEKYRTVQFTRDFESWSYGVLRNVIRRTRERQGVEQRIMMDGMEAELPHAGASDPQLKLHLQSCLREIGKKFPAYVTILGYLVDGYSREEICLQTGMKPDTLNTYISRGRKLLLECLERKRMKHG